MAKHSAESATTRKIGIVGFSQGHLHEAPYGDPEWELWGINRLHGVADGSKFQAWFNIHDLEEFHGDDHEHLQFLKDFPGPVFLRPQDIGKYPIPNAVPFPWTDLVKQFGRYFNNTISWLIAFAITQEPTDLGLYGVDMAQDALMNAEYGHQRPSCEYFLGIAAGLGISVHMPTGSDLLKTTHLYGFEDAGPMVVKWQNRLQEIGKRKEDAKAQLAQLSQQAEQVKAGINQLDGAMQDIQYNLRNWRPQEPGEPFVSPNGEVASPAEAKELANASGR